MNVVILSGNLGTDPEAKSSKKGNYTRFRLAVNRNGGGGDPLWVTVVCFDDLAEAAAKNLKKGTKVVVRGRLEQDKRGRFGVVAYEVEFLGGRASAKKQAPKAEEPEPEEVLDPVVPPEEEDEEVPF